MDTRNSAKGVDGKNGGRPLKSILKKSGNRSTVNVNEEGVVGLNKGAGKNTIEGGVAQQNTNIMEESPSMVQKRVTMAPAVIIHSFEVDYGACNTESDGNIANDGHPTGVAAVMESNNMGINGTNMGTKSKSVKEVEDVVQQPWNSDVDTDDEHNENISKQVGSQPMNEGSTSTIPSFASILCPKPVTSIHFRTLVNDEKLDSFDCVFPQGAANKVKGRYDNSLVGFLLERD